MKFACRVFKINYTYIYRNNCVHCEHLHSTSFIQTSLIRKFSTKSAVFWISATKKKADKERVWTVGG